MTDYFQINAVVDFHAVVGGPVTSRGHVVTATRHTPGTRPVAWITGRVGCVVMDALTKSAGGGA